MLRITPLLLEHVHIVPFKVGIIDLSTSMRLYVKPAVCNDQRKELWCYIWEKRIFDDVMRLFSDHGGSIVVFDLDQTLIDCVPMTGVKPADDPLCLDGDTKYTRKHRSETGLRLEGLAQDVKYTHVYEWVTAIGSKQHLVNGNFVDIQNGTDATKKQAILVFKNSTKRNEAMKEFQKSTNRYMYT